MPTKAVLQDTVNALARSLSKSDAAKVLGIPQTTLKDRLRMATTAGIKATVSRTEDLQLLRTEIKRLESALRDADRAREEALITEEKVQKQIIGLKQSPLVIPTWALKEPKHSSPGVPTLFCSDWHWDEVVKAAQIGGVNEFNREIAHKRLHALVETAIYLLRILSPKMDYPGIIAPLGGDMISGNIHDELVATNQFNTMPTILDILGKIIWMIDRLLEEFPRVFIPCVSGNHGRNTHKIWTKDRHATSFDWLIYNLLAKHYENDKRVTFLIPDGPDAYYRVFGHRYLLTHGDQFRGGDGMIGALGPIIRGDHKKRSRNAQIDMEYDTMLLGHWHQYIHHSRVIVNGCFPAGAIVTTPSGMSPIESVAVGDAVLSRDGSYQRVSNRFERISEAGLVHLKVRGLCEPLSATPNHLIWAIKSESRRCHSVGAKWDALCGGGDVPQWIPADFISPGDYVHIPRVVGTPARLLTKESAWAYGLYLAEGSTLLDGGSSGKHNRISLTMHERELPVLERWAVWFEGEYGIKPRVFHRRRAGITSELVVSPGREMCAKFRKMFGHRAGGKSVPKEMLYLSPDQARALVQGWVDGDGHKTKDGVTSATTISPALAHSMFRLALTAGMRPSMAMLRAGGRRKHDSFTVHFGTGQESVEIDGELFYRVHARYRDKQVVPVYDLEVEGEHTYTVNHVGVHNSLKGYDEYAYTNNFGFEEPQQALWVNHPKYGITFRMPVKVDRTREEHISAWVEVK